MRKILITGANGFIGSYIVEEALKRGFETWVSVRKNSSMQYIQDERIHRIDLPFGDKCRLKDALHALHLKMGGWDYIVYALGATKALHVTDFYRINCDYLINFVEILILEKIVPKQFFYLSTLGAWGARDYHTTVPTDHNQIPNPTTHYGKSKLQAEIFLQTHPTFPYIILRPTGVYGPREKDYLMQIKVIKAGFALHAGFSPQYLTYCYVEDLVTVIFLAIEHGVVHKSYFLSDGEITTNAHFEEIAARILGKKKLFVIIIPLPIIKCVCFINEMLYTHILHRPTTINRDKYEILSARNWICGNDKVCKDLDFKPAFNLEKGLEKTIAWNQKQGTL